jgi:nucleotide-binding universal stress UspA family protein
MTRKLERILIAIDESSSANAAIELGLAIAGDEGAYVIFAHVVSIAGGPFVPGNGKPDRIPERALTSSTSTSSSSAPGT